MVNETSPSEYVNLRLVGDVVGPDFVEFLQDSQSWCSTALLVHSASMRLSAKGQAFTAELERFQLEVRDEEEWPGTRLFGHTRPVYRFRLDELSADYLSRSASSLLSLKPPDRLEDLCLLRPDGSAWLGSVTHERDAWLQLKNDEFSKLCEKAPSWFERFS